MDKVLIDGKESTLEVLEEMKKNKKLKVEQISEGEFKTKQLLMEYA